MKQELLNQKIVKSIGVTAKLLNKISFCSIALLIFFTSLFIQQTKAQGIWTPLNNLAPDPNAGVMILMSDGTILCKTASGGSDGYGNIWDKLTPDTLGSYVNGTWSQIAPMIDTRLYFSTQVLKDGRLYVAGGEYGSGEPNSEVYNPVTNVWTSCPSTGHNYVDASSEI